MFTLYINLSYGFDNAGAIVCLVLSTTVYLEVK
jgi:hypothetical protein